MMTDEDRAEIKLMIGEALLEERRNHSRVPLPTRTFEDMTADRRRQECRESNQIPCGFCGRPSGTPRGVTHAGKMCCSSCRSKQMRVRG
jgi:hypothetical protein